MCLAIPARVEAVEDGDMAIVAVGGVRKRISTALLDTVAIGDYVLVHVGYALHRLSEEEAENTLAMMAAAGLLDGELEEMTGRAS
ncbi:HypC/HybG/HupF family hydrogenase formation chaperone [Martelella lutilitoris]|uniref:Hydrogenase maturation factor HypC n=1 Tax=Martelella lutilitoris TaxID=2583532 RepID=A0A5C4JLD9_9HYPH|nr:HypC/HybG/HupF family hydrogenase formation chaperone [Martelella lutilitoris]TNB46253.1 HypC/HybG/HupF family hydrogenase formation chaperone [Martelella lutilitoris]